jgi:hypothetical protein
LRTPTGLGLDGADLLAQVALEGFGRFAAATQTEDASVLDVFDPEGQPTIEGGGEDGQPDVAGGRLHPGARRQLVEAVQAVADGGHGDECREDGFTEDGGGAPNRASTRARERLNTPSTALVWGGGEE